MDKVLVIDGHSVIHTTEELAVLHSQQQHSAREKLHRLLSDFQCVSDYSVILVFDGKGTKKFKQTGSKGEAMLMYSSGGETADAVIEQLCARHASKYNVSVVSNDRMVLDSVSVSGAFPMSVRSFWEIYDRS